MRLCYFFIVFMVCSWSFIACSDDDGMDGTLDNNEEGTLPEDGNMFADFETYDTSPYFFRYGNFGGSSTGTNDYYPRWAYSHAIVDNPLKSDENSSDKVLKYTSMEARNYGLKLRFPEILTIGKIKGIRLQIYQPSNVIGKDTWNGTSKATVQQLKVKLINSFNPINDYRQEEGALLNASESTFEKEGLWLTYTFTVDEKSSASVLLSDGIAGLVILPTYGSNVTLSESSFYTCYIDNIEIL